MQPVIRATIDLLTGSVRYDPWAVDDWEGERWVLEARTRNLADGRTVRWVLEKRGGTLVGCTHWWATREALAEQYGADAAARFFPSGEQRAEVILEVPIPIEMEPTDRRRTRRAAPAVRAPQVSVGANG
ncbi:MAG TPA: hypothetical protein VFV75_10775 [Candidatus Polarisedimenticolaceae bacterium]|nr:hypothetical protein [Candidatus Polarisedimenticolaceae bacterium]